jgi:hypothetical protein
MVAALSFALFSAVSLLLVGVSELQLICGPSTLPIFLVWLYLSWLVCWRGSDGSVGEMRPKMITLDGIDSTGTLRSRRSVKADSLPARRWVYLPETMKKRRALKRGGGEVQGAL